LHDKDQGCYDDYMEVLRLYDKQEDGTLPFAELRHVLLAIGENFEADVLDPFLAEATVEEDDEGMIPYAPFAKKLVDGPFPDEK
jgi:myosin light chain 6